MQKCKKPNRLRGVWGRGLVGALVGGFECFTCFVLALRACFGGCVETLETRCVGACRVLVVLGRWWGLQRFCKIYAKITNFCATIAPIGLGRVI